MRSPRFNSPGVTSTLRHSTRGTRSCTPSFSGAGRLAIHRSRRTPASSPRMGALGAYGRNMSLRTWTASNASSARSS